MTLWFYADGLVLELDRPEIELVLTRCALGRPRACWIASQTGAVLSRVAVGVA
jgi:hypothetical protein